MAGLGLGFKWEAGKARLAPALYAELALGLRLWSSASRTSAELQLGNPFDEDKEAYKTASGLQKPARLGPVHAWIPSSHSVFVETGVFESYFGMRRCVQGCVATDPAAAVYVDVSKMLVTPFAGLRYVYYSEAAQERPIVNRVRYAHVFAHALFRPLWQPEGTLETLDGDAIRRAPVGARVGVMLPVLWACRVAGGGCPEAGLSAGYSPFPALAMFSAHLHVSLN